MTMRRTLLMMSREEAQRIADKLLDNGRQIEAAWVLTALPGAPTHMSDYQIEAMRACFYLGADYVLQTVVKAEDWGWTPDDVANNFTALLKELDAFILGRTLQAARERGETPH